VDEDGQDDGAGDAGKADVDGVQVNGRCDDRVAAVNVEKGGIVRQTGYYAHRCGLTGIRVFELLESIRRIPSPNIEVVIKTHKMLRAKNILFELQ